MVTHIPYTESDKFQNPTFLQFGLPSAEAVPFHDPNHSQKFDFLLLGASTVDSCPQLSAWSLRLVKKTGKCPLISTHEVSPPLFLKSCKGYRKGVLTPATGRGMSSSFYSHHSLNTHSDQNRGTRGEKQSTHTQPRGPTSQPRQRAAAAEPHLGALSPV